MKSIIQLGLTSLISLQNLSACPDVPKTGPVDLVEWNNFLKLASGEERSAQKANQMMLQCFTKHNERLTPDHLRATLNSVRSYEKNSEAPASDRISHLRFLTDYLNAHPGLDAMDAVLKFSETAPTSIALQTLQSYTSQRGEKMSLDQIRAVLLRAELKSIYSIDTLPTRLNILEIYFNWKPNVSVEDGLKLISEQSSSNNDRYGKNAVLISLANIPRQFKVSEVESLLSSAEYFDPIQNVKARLRIVENAIASATNFVSGADVQALKLSVLNSEQMEDLARWHFAFSNSAPQFTFEDFKNFLEMIVGPKSDPKILGLIQTYMDWATTQTNPQKVQKEIPVDDMVTMASYIRTSPSKKNDLLVKFYLDNEARLTSGDALKIVDALDKSESNYLEKKKTITDKAAAKSCKEIGCATTEIFDIADTLGGRSVCGGVSES